MYNYALGHTATGVLTVLGLPEPLGFWCKTSFFKRTHPIRVKHYDEGR